LRVLHINSSDIYGGAAKAVLSLHNSLMNENIQSYILTNNKNTEIKNDISKSSSLRNIIDIFKNGVARKICKLYSSNKKETLSISIFKTNILKEINNFDCDLINLHWICSEFISIEQIKKINKPIVWSLYDMWPFSGAEHYSDDERYKIGYLQNNRNKDESGIDINKWVWNRKKKNFNFPFKLVAPSQWLQHTAQESSIFKNFKIEKVGHPIDIEFWKPSNKINSKEILNISSKKKLLVFFSSGSTQNHRKGLDYLFEIIKKLKIDDNKYELLIVGQKKIKNFLGKDNVKYINYLKDEISRKILYSAADLILSPSRREAFGLVVAESAACGVPSVGFENTGLSETIQHKKTGYLAKENNVNDFATGVEWFFEDVSRFGELGLNAREHIKSNFMDKLIAKKYINIYQNILNIKNK
tara:strand:- start:1300 stop:2541 length:1242 start_codon:yes stop_codon:yes gene_type:complete